jgi:hypothetical protein
MDISKFGTQYSGDYARPNLFVVNIAQIDTAMWIKATTLPATTVGVVEVPYQNRKMKVPGDRTFVDWTATIINDEAYVVRGALLAWQQGITGFSSFASTMGVSEAHRKIEIQPINRAGEDSTHSVNVYGWPSEVGTIDLSWETPDAVQEYTVTFAVSWDDGGVDTESVDVLS